MAQPPLSLRQFSLPPTPPFEFIRRTGLVKEIPPAKPVEERNRHVRLQCHKDRIFQHGHGELPLTEPEIIKKRENIIGSKISQMSVFVIHCGILIQRFLPWYMDDNSRMRACDSAQTGY